MAKTDGRMSLDYKDGGHLRVLMMWLTVHPETISNDNHPFEN